MFGVSESREPIKGEFAKKVIEEMQRMLKLKKEGKDVAIIATGIMVHEALQAAQKLEAEGISVAVIDPFTIKPLDAELIRNYAAKTGCVVTAENHNKQSGNHRRHRTETQIAHQTRTRKVEVACQIVK